MKKKPILLICFIIFSIYHISIAQIGINLGTEYGLGLMMQTGSDAVKFELGGGLNPLLVVWEITEIGFGYSSSDTKVKLYFPGLVGAKVSFKMSGEEKKDRLGLKMGVSYNSIMKTGYGVGVSYEMVESSNSIIISGGISYFPKAGDKLLDRLNEEENTHFTQSDVQALFLNIQPFIGLSILW